jgi:hypothetical protein
MTNASHEHAWIDGVGRRGTADPLDLSTIQAPKSSSDVEPGKRHFDAK